MSIAKSLTKSPTKCLINVKKICLISHIVSRLTVIWLPLFLKDIDLFFFGLVYAMVT